MSPQQHKAGLEAVERIKCGGWAHANELGLLDLTYVNCMARFWVTFSDDHSEVGGGDKDCGDDGRGQEKYKVLVDNGSELIENVIYGVIDSLLAYP